MFNDFRHPLAAPPVRRLPSIVCAAATLALTAAAHADLGVQVSAATYGGLHQAADPLSASVSAVGTIPSLYLANAFASADLVSGTLRGLSFGENVGFGLPPESLANSSSSITDVITFHGAGTSVLVDLEMDVDGFFTLNGAPGLTSLHTYGAFTLGNDVSASVNLTRYFNSYSSQDYLDGSVTGSAGTFLDKTLNTANAHLVYLAEVPLNVGLTFNSVLQTFEVPGAPGLAATDDFSNTAQLSLHLPDGYSYTSASGHFLSAPSVSPVPEPDSIALMLAGLTMIGTILHRRRRMP